MEYVPIENETALMIILHLANWLIFILPPFERRANKIESPISTKVNGKKDKNNIERIQNDITEKAEKQEDHRDRENFET